jgi:Methyltransferase domain/YCII-related domain
MPIVTDGPFAETKEAVGYCRTIQVRSKQEAIEWANRCPGFDNEYDRDSSSTEAVGFSHRPGEAVVALLAQAKQRKASWCPGPAAPGHPSQAPVGESRRVAGVEPSKKLLASARGKAIKKRLTIDLRQGGVEQLDFPDKSFDVVTSSFVMHQGPPPTFGNEDHVVFAVPFRVA